MDRATLKRRQKKVQYIENLIKSARLKLAKAPSFRGRQPTYALLATAQNHLSALRENLRVDEANLD